MEEIEIDIDNDNDANNYPNSSTLVLKTVLSCLEDSQPLVRKNILDFMITNLKPFSPILTK
jgi:hypothetical protein